MPTRFSGAEWEDLSLPCPPNRPSVSPGDKWPPLPTPPLRVSAHPACSPGRPAPLGDNKVGGACGPFAPPCSDWAGPAVPSPRPEASGWGLWSLVPPCSEWAGPAVPSPRPAASGRSRGPAWPGRLGQNELSFPFPASSAAKGSERDIYGPGMPPSVEFMSGGDLKTDAAFPWKRQRVNRAGLFVNLIVVGLQ